MNELDGRKETVARIAEVQNSVIDDFVRDTDEFKDYSAHLDQMAERGVKRHDYMNVFLDYCFEKADFQVPESRKTLVDKYIRFVEADDADGAFCVAGSIGVIGGIVSSIGCAYYVAVGTMNGDIIDKIASTIGVFFVGGFVGTAAAAALVLSVGSATYILAEYIKKAKSNSYDRKNNAIVEAKDVIKGLYKQRRIKEISEIVGGINYGEIENRVLEYAD